MTRQSLFQLFALVCLVASMGYAFDGIAADSRATETKTTPVADRQAVNPNEPDRGTSGPLKLREGVKLVNQVGELRDQGGRIAFYPEGETQSLQLLENLALERVSRDLGQPNRKWSVSGVVTEYKGGNFLLLHRAVLKARVSNAPGPRS